MAPAATPSSPPRRRSATCSRAQLVRGLIRQSPASPPFFYREISRKLDALAADERGAAVGSLMRARVRDAATCSPPSSSTASDTIEAAGHRMREIDTNALFVRDGDRIGIVTGMNLSKAVVLQRLPLETPVARPRPLRRRRRSTPDDFVFAALLLMTKHNKRPLAVRDGDLSSAFSRTSTCSAFSPATRSSSPAASTAPPTARRSRRSAAREIAAQVERLRRQGVKVEVIAEIISDLNRRLFAKLFELHRAAVDPAQAAA